MHKRLIIKFMGSLFFLLFLSFIHVDCAVAGVGDLNAKENPFTPKAYLTRYWDKTIHNDLPKSSFLLSKASPLNALDSAKFVKHAAQRTLSTVLPSFCSLAKLFCFPDSSPSLQKNDTDWDFALYANENFTNYGKGKLGGVDSFTNYSSDNGLSFNSFRGYSRDSSAHKEKFSIYSLDGGFGDQSFNTYGTSATDGAGDFKNYGTNLRFTTYSNNGKSRAQSFTTYSESGNSDPETFSSYGKKGIGEENEFVAYAQNSNAIQSNFTSYGETAQGAVDKFKSYGTGGNIPEEYFKNYGEGVNGGVESFTNYNLHPNVARDDFNSYAKNSNSEKVNFVNYGESFSGVANEFYRYGQNAEGHQIGFKVYGSLREFKDYNKNGVTFAVYAKERSAAAAARVSGNMAKRWVVEPGKFFRESMLKKGTVMPMPDIRDKMPERSFLPRSIVSKLPFTSSNVSEIKQIFHAIDNSTMDRIIKDALSECERAPSRGETKRCVGSAEDMIDFATSVLGTDVAMRTTENVQGSKQNIMIGSVKGINGGKVTESVSCHQSLYPYLLYYCHSVPKVRVYEADILNPKTKEKINHGFAICHLDTSAWSATHGAFMALGSGPGRIEVCHWIFENDLTWTVADPN